MKNLLDTNLTIAFAGGFGHMVEVLNDLQLDGAPSVDYKGSAPVYRNENMDALHGHPWIAGHDAGNSYSNLEALLEDVKPDVLVVSTRPDQIADAVAKGLVAGCHVITEKPLALSLDRLAQLEQLAGESDVALLAMLSMRRFQPFRLARKWIQDGVIGQVSLVNTRKSYRWGMRPDWFKDRSLYGGTWPWIGIHNMDMAHFLTDRHAVSGSAFHACRVHTDYADCEDLGVGCFELEGGVLMTASIDYLRPESAATHGDDWCRVVGERGIIEASVARSEVKSITDAGEEVVQLDEQPVPIFGEWIRRLAQDPESLVCDDTAIRLTRSVLAARDAADRMTGFRL